MLKRSAYVGWRTEAQKSLKLYFQPSTIHTRPLLLINGNWRGEVELIVTHDITDNDREELFVGLRCYNYRFINPASFGQIGIFHRNSAGTMTGGLIATRK